MQSEPRGWRQAPPRPAASSGRKPLPPRKPGDCAGVSRAPPPPKPATFNDADEHVDSAATGAAGTRAPGTSISAAAVPSN